MHSVRVELLERSYDVRVRPGLDGLGAAVVALGFLRVVLVTEARVHPLWGAKAEEELRGAGLEVDTVVLPAGEEHKTLETWSTCVSQLLHLRTDRSVAVVALGGGVLGDIAGFAAASTMRGVPVIQVPTTVLAMVDSSVGGKTAVNHARGTNLVGAFHQPSLVWAAVETLQTLPKRERLAGLAELVKVAWLADAQRVGWIGANAQRLVDGESNATAQAVAYAVQLKANVVAMDETEQGWRAVLNLGHTVGHALEHALGYGTVLHGEAVAMGMVVEARYAERRGWCTQATVSQLQDLLRALQLPVTCPDVSAQRCVAALELDKKRRGTILTFPVVSAPGCTRLVRLPLHDLARDLPGLL